MTERPILFSGPMVRAILDERKTQTRRVVKLPHSNPLGQWEPTAIGGPNGGRTKDGRTIPEQSAIWHTRTCDSVLSPYVTGDRLWVREAWRTTGDSGRADDIAPRDLQPHSVWYEAAGSALVDECAGKLRPGMFMPRWASRITLEVTDVRVERLQSISETDALAEGIYLFPAEGGGYKVARGEQEYDTAIDAYRHLWDSLNAARGYGWDANPWVWVLEFRRVVR